MTVKERVGRQRYIAFRIEPVIRKDFFYREMKTLLKKLTYVHFPSSIIKYSNGYGIIRCSHVDKEKVIKYLNSITKLDYIDVKIETLKCSGTIKALRRKITLTNIYI